MSAIHLANLLRRLTDSEEPGTTLRNSDRCHTDGSVRGQTSDLRHLLREFKERLDPDVVFNEPINPRGSNFAMIVEAIREAGLEYNADEFANLKDCIYWVEYSVEQLEAVERIGEEIGVPIHLWPDKQLV